MPPFVCFVCSNSCIRQTIQSFQAFYGENHARVGGAHGATEIFGSIMSEPLTDYVDSNLASWPVLKTPCSPILSPVVLHTDTQHYVGNLRLGKL